MNYKLAILSTVLMLNTGLVSAEELSNPVPKKTSLEYDFERTAVYNNEMFIVDFNKKNQKTREEVKEELLKAKQTNTMPKTNIFSPF